MHWCIAVDSVGAFELPPVENPPVGNYRVSLGDTLRVFVPAGSLVNQDNVRLYVENGVGVTAEVTGTYDPLGNLIFDWTVHTDTAGLCEFSFLYRPYRDDGSSQDPPLLKKSIVNKVLVEPIININSTVLPPAAISIQTVLSRCLGPIDTWVAQLRSATANLHYNVIHFTPVQTPGESGSCYSIAQHLDVSPELLPESLRNSPRSEGWRLLQTTVQELETSCGLLSTCDIVLNHTASNTSWLGEHPECGYTVDNTPHLAAALELDLALQQFSARIARNEFERVSRIVQDEQSLKSLLHLLQTHVLEPFHLHEWFEIPIDAVLEEFRSVPLLPDPQYLHHPQLGYHATLGDPFDTLFNDCLRTVGVARKTGIRPDITLLRDFARDAKHARELLHAVQQRLWDESKKTYGVIMNAIEGYVRWERLECHRGPIEEVHWNAVVPRYFTPMKDEKGTVHYLANNGWVMGWDASSDFMSPGSLVYLNRSLVAWSDCVKLRYGNSRDDVPFLWDYMGAYCRQAASIFFGIRLDNCHTTPLHVAKFCLHECRKVNPNVWIYAELFTGNRDVDLKFERELGLNAFIREAMQASSCSDLAYHIQEYSGPRIGSLSKCSALHRFAADPKHVYHQLIPTMGTCLLYDCTHDNKVPHEKRTACDALPNAAAVAASVCAIGSSRGYDELIPRGLSVVTEHRKYYTYADKLPDGSTPSESPARCTLKTAKGLEYTAVHVVGSWDGWAQRLTMKRQQSSWTVDIPSQYFVSRDRPKTTEYHYKFVGDEHVWFHDPALPHQKDAQGNINNVWRCGSPRDSSHWRMGDPLPGLMEARKILNQLHQRLSVEEYTECNADVLQESIMVITRHQPRTHRFCLFYLHCAFSPADLCRPSQPLVHRFKGRVEEVLLEAHLNIPHDAHFYDDPNAINGLPSELELAEGSPRTTSLRNWFVLNYDTSIDETTITFKSFPAGSVVILLTQGHPRVRESVQHALSDIGHIVGQHLPGTKVTREMELQAFSYILYSCSNEERERSKGVRGCYALPQIGELPYAGLAGIVPLLDTIRFTNEDQYHHPLIENLRSGNWLLDYLTDRLDSELDDAFQDGVLIVLLNTAVWMREAFREPLRCLPRNLLPYYLDWIVSAVYSWMAQRVMTGYAEPLQLVVDPLVPLLCLATLQFYTYVPTAPLYPNTTHPSLAAGLPHFSTQWMRCWGRDTFIAFKGCFLLSQRYSMARDELLAYGRVVRHGLVPNLLASGIRPRYNSRDATWLFLQAIQDYCREAPEGDQFLTTSLDLSVPLESHSPWAKRCFPQRSPPYKTVTIAELIHYLMASHVFGINVREWEAGPSLDAHMQHKGFDLSITVDRGTGIVYGGNPLNCGTWMDKMGSSTTAKNAGIPATPRDGAAVEINGLVKSTLRFLNSLPNNVFPFTMIDPEAEFTYSLWEQRLQQAFDKLFYIPKEDTAVARKVGSSSVIPMTDYTKKQLNPALIHRRGIYRDTLNASETWRDYQLRPNYCVALSVAPELCPKDHAVSSLQCISTLLFGMKTPKALQEEVELYQKRKGPDAVEVIRAMVNDNVRPTYTPQLGLKTLDPADYNYHGDYNNDDRSSNFAVADGFNYHNGPEWLWLLGHFLQAKRNVGLPLEPPNSTTSSTAHESPVPGLHSAPSDKPSESFHIFLFDVMRYLHTLRRHILADRWLSLPELTNANGQYCRFGCPAQAWSVATVLAFLHDVAVLRGTTTSAPVATVIAKTKLQKAL